MKLHQLLPQNIQERHCPTKSWGWEEWIVNNAMYCGKRLHFNKLDGSTSLHFHKNKHETMYCDVGSFLITLIDTATAKEERVELGGGDSLVIEPLTPHRITAIRLAGGSNEAILIEFSTHHEDDDSYRIWR